MTLRPKLQKGAKSLLDHIIKESAFYIFSRVFNSWMSAPVMPKK